MSSALAQGWLDAAAQGALRTELETIYERTADAITARGPVCWASGRCCNFEKAGHRLYVTGLEAAYVLTSGGVLTKAMLEEARGRGGCGFAAGNLCGVHGIKPLGCRIYFCDRSAQEWQQELHEQMLGELRGLHERWDIAYRYGEWGAMLELLLAAGD